MSVYEAFPGRVPKNAQDHSDDLLRPEDRFTAEERARPRLTWLRQGAEHSREGQIKAQSAQSPRSHVSINPYSSEKDLLSRSSNVDGRAKVLLDTSVLKNLRRQPAPSLQKISTDVSHSVDRTVDLVAAYVSKNALPSGELPTLIASVHRAINKIEAASLDTEPTLQAERVAQPSAAQIRSSIRHDGLLSFIDGKFYKTLKRHLSAHGLDPKTYRERYGLPVDYPMVAPSYAEQRSALAKAIGLGQPNSTARHTSKKDRVA